MSAESRYEEARKADWDARIKRMAEDARKDVSGGYLYGRQIDVDNPEHLLAVIFAMDKFGPRRKIDRHDF